MDVYKPMIGKLGPTSGDYKRWKKGKIFLRYHEPKPKVGRNLPCPCGSGKKFKHCCLDAEEV